LSLSEQQLISCSTENYGCDGGLAEFAYLYSDPNPLMSEVDYPYTDYYYDAFTNNQTAGCNYSSSQGLVSANGFSYVPMMNPRQLQAAINLGPVTVAVAAS